MSDRPPAVDARDWEFLQTLEGRRNQSDSIAWTVPSLAVAAEAFLLTVALRPETQDAGRFVASLAGVIVLFAALHLLWKSVFNFDVWDAHINAQRRSLHLRGVLTRNDLFRVASSFPEGEKIRDRQYETRWRPRYWLAYKWPSSSTWIVAIELLLILNLILALYSLGEWLGVIDWNWFGPNGTAPHGHGNEHGRFRDD